MQQQPSTTLAAISEVSRRIKASIGLKVLVISILMAALLIPISMIKGLVAERQERQESAFAEISSKWADAQRLNGPIISIPYMQRTGDQNSVRNAEKVYYHLLPDELHITCKLQPEKRYRGIYEVAVYKAEMRLEGTFPVIAVHDNSIQPQDILYDQAFLSLGISDLRGIENDVELTWDEKPLSFNPGVETGDVVKNGIQASLGTLISANETIRRHFSCVLSLRGSRELLFAPVAKRTDVQMSSTWTDPSFCGAFLPNARNVSASGFEAQWTVLNVNRNYPQHWSGSKFSLNESEFGMSLLVPIDNYSKTDRAVKYAFLLVGLTFLIYLFLEIRNKASVHILQYMLVGLALCIFYVLLLSITEHLSFNTSYLIASIMTIGIISWYSNFVLGRKQLALMVGICLTLLYALLFTILQLQDYALLAGSFALFFILAIIMYYSRAIQWQRAVADEEQSISAMRTVAQDAVAESSSRVIEPDSSSASRSETPRNE